MLSDCTRRSVRLTFNYTRVLKRQCILLFKFLRIRDAARHVKLLIGCKKLFPLHFNASILRLLMLHLVLPCFKICQDQKKRFLESLNVAITTEPLCAFSHTAPWSVLQDRRRWGKLPPRESDSRKSQVAVVVRKEEAWGNHFFLPTGVELSEPLHYQLFSFNLKVKSYCSHWNWFSVSCFTSSTFWWGAME